jgi:hypothetical protein
MGWTIGRSRQRRKHFSCSPCVQTGSGTHPASCAMGSGGPFPGAKARPGRDADHSLHLVSRSRMSRSYTSSIPRRLRGVQWHSFNFTIASNMPQHPLVLITRIHPAVDDSLYNLNETPALNASIEIAAENRCIYRLRNTLSVAQTMGYSVGL